MLCHVLYSVIYDSNRCRIDNMCYVYIVCLQWTSDVNLYSIGSSKITDSLSSYHELVISKFISRPKPISSCNIHGCSEEWGKGQVFTKCNYRLIT